MENLNKLPGVYRGPHKRFKGINKGKYFWELSQTKDSPRTSFGPYETPEDVYDAMRRTKIKIKECAEIALEYVINKGDVNVPK